jgi:hypothetical protein
MSEGKRTVRLYLFLGILASTAAGYAEPPDFLTQLSQAREAMLSEPARGYYEGPFNKPFYGRFSAWLNQCTQQTGQGLVDLDLLLGLDAQGKVSAVRVQPESGLTECFADQVRKAQFPAPPSGGLSLPVSVRITKQ